MHHVSRRRRVVKQQAEWGGSATAEHEREAGRYPHPLQFYALPPTEEVSLEEFEMLAVDRLRGKRGKGR